MEKLANGGTLSVSTSIYRVKTVSYNILAMVLNYDITYYYYWLRIGWLSVSERIPQN
jgi:hypothetical protein